MRKRRIAVTVAIALCAALALGIVWQDQEKQLPSAASKKLRADLQSAFKAGKIKGGDDLTNVRKQLAIDALATVRTENISDDERLTLSSLLKYAGKHEEAMTIAHDIMQGGGLLAQRASATYLSFLADAERFAEVETGIREYRSRFSPTPEFMDNLYLPVFALAANYQRNGEHEKAVQAVLAEIETLDLSAAPYISYTLLDEYAESFAEVGKQGQLEQICVTIGERAKAIVEERNKDPQAGDKGFASTTYWYNQIAETLTAVKAGPTLVGRPAPGFTFTHYFNTDPVTLDNLKGKVVMIDFWANWCGPCKAAFPHLRELYTKYKDQGFVILSVTSLQGSFTDGDIRESDISPERETELTAELIKRYGMTWPVVISDRSCFDPEYGVRGIPTFALIGRDGVIRHIGVGAGEGTAAMMEQWLPKLLAEEE